MTVQKTRITVADEGGGTWSAGFAAEDGPDYKGRFYMLFTRDGVLAPLHDVRWNSEDIARRTLNSMSRGELRRRLKLALSRR